MINVSKKNQPMKAARTDTSGLDKIAIEFVKFCRNQPRKIEFSRYSSELPAAANSAALRSTALEKLIPPTRSVHHGSLRQVFIEQVPFESS